MRYWYFDGYLHNRIFFIRRNRIFFSRCPSIINWIFGKEESSFVYVVIGMPISFIMPVNTMFYHVSPSLAACLEPLAGHRNVISLSLSIGITLVDFHLNWLNWSHFFILEVGLLVLLIDCMISLSPFLDGTRMSMSTVSFLAYDP